MADQSAIAASFADLFERRLLELEAEGQRPAADLPEFTYHAVEKDGQITAIWEMRGRDHVRTIDPNSRQGQEILRRYAAESPDAPHATPTPDLSALFSKVEEVAAVSGRFSPRDIVTEPADEATRNAVLTRLVAGCIVETHESEVRWLLAKEPRRAILARLKEEGRLALALEGLLPPTDRFGNMLRALLSSGAALNLSGLGREDLLALISAIETTVDLGLPQPDVTQVRRMMGRPEFLSEYDVLLGKGFYGRRKELARIKAFVEEPGGGPRGWAGLVLTGLGGAGKSTLIARFARDAVKRGLATVAILDFDLPGVDAGDTYWLEQEMCRQVGYQYPGENEFLRQRRQEERRHRAEYGETVAQSASDAAEFDRASRGIVLSIREALVHVAADARPFLLVLDTFEEVAEQGLARRVFNWLNEIGSALSPTPLKVIFSGRVFEGDLEVLEKEGAARSVEVGELEPAFAEKLLRALDVPEEAARRLARSDLLPRRPLELTLLAKITSDLDKSIDALEKDVRAGGDATRELFAGLVYRRVLRRLSDPVAQELAYPGLVLRYVTRELIQEVLIPALQLPPLDDTKAGKALDMLAACGWLVRREGEEVWHRRDLRRSTLKAMIAWEPERAERIHRAAVAFFERPGGGPKEFAEALYHRLMLSKEPDENDAFELPDLKRAYEHIRADVADLPQHSAALLKFAATGKAAPHEVELLPSRHLRKAYRDAGKRLAGSREFGKALRLFNRYHWSGVGAPEEPHAESLGPWEIETLFATVSWETLLLRRPFSASAYRSFRPLSVRMIAAYCFPDALVRKEFDAKLFRDMLRDEAADERTLAADLAGADAETILRALSVGLVVAVSEGSAVTLAPTFGRILRAIEKSRRRLSPVVERRLMLLERVLGTPQLFTDTYLSAHTVKLDPGWVKELPAYLHGNHVMKDSGRELDRLLWDVEAILKKGQGRGSGFTARKMLGMIDALSKEGGRRRGTAFSLTWKTDADSFLRFFRGPDPEFRDPCRFALLEAFPDRASRRRLAEVIASLLRLELDDLEPDAFADALAADPEHALESYVELVDRTWALDELIQRAQKVAGDSPKLAELCVAYRRWNRAFHRTVAQAF